MRHGAPGSRCLLVWRASHVESDRPLISAMTLRTGCSSGRLMYQSSQSKCACSMTFSIIPPINFFSGTFPTLASGAVAARLLPSSSSDPERLPADPWEDRQGHCHREPAQGDDRSLLVHGARSCVMHMDRSRGRLGAWLDGLERRMHGNKVTVAARGKDRPIAWVILAATEGSLRAARSRSSVGPPAADFEARGSDDEVVDRRVVRACLRRGFPE